MSQENVQINEGGTETTTGYKAMPWIVGIAVVMLLCGVLSLAGYLLLGGVASNDSNATIAEETPGAETVVVTRVVTDNAAEAELAAELAAAEAELAAAEARIPVGPGVNYSDDEKLAFTADLTGYNGWNVVGDEPWAYNFNAKGVLDAQGNQVVITFQLPAEERDNEGNVIARWQVTSNSPATGVMFWVSGGSAVTIQASDATIRYLPLYGNMFDTDWEKDGDTLFVGEGITAEEYGYTLTDMRAESNRVTPMPTAEQIAEYRIRIGR